MHFSNSVRKHTIYMYLSCSTIYTRVATWIYLCVKTLNKPPSSFYTDWTGFACYMYKSISGYHPDGWADPRLTKTKITWIHIMLSYIDQIKPVHRYRNTVHLFINFQIYVQWPQTPSATLIHFRIREFCNPNTDSDSLASSSKHEKVWKKV